MLDEWGLARFIGYLGGAVAFCFFTHRRESLDAPSGYGFRRRVVLGAVCPPAGTGFAGDQDTDTPDVAVKGEKQVNSGE